MKIRVKPGTVQLPHKLTARGIDYLFAPSAEVPDDFGAALIKTNPEVFEQAVGEDDLSFYKFKTEFKKQSISDVIAKLDDKDTLRVYEFAMSLAEAQATGETVATPEEAKPKGKGKK